MQRSRGHQKDRAADPAARFSQARDPEQADRPHRDESRRQHGVDPHPVEGDEDQAYEPRATATNNPNGTVNAACIASAADGCPFGRVAGPPRSFKSRVDSGKINIPPINSTNIAGPGESHWYTAAAANQMSEEIKGPENPFL